VTDEAKPAPTAPRRVRAFLDNFTDGDGPMSREVIHRYQSERGDVDLTVTDLEALLALAALGRQVLEHLYFEVDDDGKLSHGAERNLLADVREWRDEERLWTWHAPKAIARARALAAEAARSET
jgi:hypothetical protein